MSSTSACFATAVLRVTFSTVSKAYCTKDMWKAGDCMWLWLKKYSLWILKNYCLLWNLPSKWGIFIKVFHKAPHPATCDNFPRIPSFLPRFVFQAGWVTPTPRYQDVRVMLYAGHCHRNYGQHCMHCIHSHTKSASWNWWKLRLHQNGKIM